MTMFMDIGQTKFHSTRASIDSKIILLSFPKTCFLRNEIEDQSCSVIISKELVKITYLKQSRNTR